MVLQPTQIPLQDITPTIIGSLVPPSSDPEQQTYYDPVGWYAINFPSDLKFDTETNRYRKGNRFFETGYLPEMGTMSTAVNVCAWLVNSMEDNPQDYSINWMPNGEESCSISTKSNNSRQVRTLIYENLDADSTQRFVYTKIGWSSSEGSPDNGFRINFSWQKPINGGRLAAKYVPISTEEAAGWESMGHVLTGASIKEYALPSGSNPYKEMLISVLPDEALPVWARDDYVKVSTETPQRDEITWLDLGYTVETEMMAISSGPYPRKRLYRDGRVLFDYVYEISKLYNVENDENSFTAFTVTTMDLSGAEDAFIIQNDAIRQWTSSHQDPPFAPIVYQDSLLWLKVNEDWDQVQVIKTNPDSIEPIFSFTVYTEPLYSTKKFVPWNDHWVWAAGDFLIQDGEIINEKLGVQEIFLWRVNNDKPVFLFRKAGRVGLSYDGNVLPLEYQDVARYLCCGYAVNNPILSDTEARFFAVRDGVWYYVVINY